LWSFQINLFYYLNEKDLKDENSEWYKVSGDVALIIPLIELACDKVLFINESVYFNKQGTGFNDL
jgi:hypothetical protein